MSLTRKQKELLDYIRAYAADNDDVAPSFDEMAAALGLKSKSGAFIVWSWRWKSAALFAAWKTALAP